MYNGFLKNYEKRTMQRHPNFKTSVISRIFGSIATKSFPSFLQIFINETYTKKMKVDLSEFDKAHTYKTLNKLFTRSLQKPRSIDKNPNIFISPCDGFISAYGKIKENLALQIKGFSYNVKSLLGDYIEQKEKDKLDGGSFINFYLSPKDYHRYHSPIDMTITKAVHIPGKLYPVNMKWLKKIDGLFIENERVVLECYTTENKLFYMVFVGALNVGKMCFTFDKNIQTNAKGSIPQCYTYPHLHVKKGAELGHFEMGSTIVMLFEKDSFDIKAKENLIIRFGQIIGAK